jgi:CHAT domain-containing protein
MRVMRSLAAVLIAVCSLLAACKSEDTESAAEWPRSVEPRLGGFSTWRPCRRTSQPGSPIETADCGAPTVEPLGCAEKLDDDPMKAKRLLLTQPTCTDIAIAALQQLARKDRNLLPDLAAAYYVSAQRDDRASDLLRALDALRGAPQTSEAFFNRALIEEALGLNDDALASWNKYLETDRSLWANEARQHRDALMQRVDGETLWKRHREQLLAALSRRDRAKIAELIAPFQRSAQQELETLALQNLEHAALLAEELSRFGADPYPTEVVRAWRRNPKAMQAAYGLLRAAKTRSEIGRAAIALEKAGSPLHLDARLKQASAIANTTEPGAFAQAMALLQPLEERAERSGYVHLTAKIHKTRAFYLLYQSRYLAAMRESSAALEDYSRLGDEESVADTHMTRVGEFRWAGAKERAFRQALIALRHAHRLVRADRRHSLYGEAAQTTLALGYPHVALRYQEKAIDLVKKAIPPTDARNLHLNLAAALRGRAEIKIHIGDPTANDDLESAKRLAEGQEREVRRILQARIDTAQGNSQRGRRAAAFFTTALELTSKENHTVRADLLSRRADAFLAAGQLAAAKQDRVDAIQQLELEEQRMLQGRRRGEGEELWIPYFARFQDVYRRLIRQLLDEGALDQAFFYTEKARAAEPLDLFTEGEARAPFMRQKLQAKLPRGTVLVEYVVLERDTIVWIVSRDRFQIITLPNVGPETLERWSKRVQRGVRFSLLAEFMAPLREAYPVLIAPVLEAIGATPERIVFVPDGAIHGLPLAALHDTVGGQRRYLVQQTTIEIAGSAQLYLLSLDRDRELQSSPNQAILLAGDPAFDRQLPEARGLGPLPEAQREVKLVRAVYTDAKVLLSEEATPERILELAPHYGVLHIAAHSIPDADAPFRSVILLAKSPGDSGALYAQDLVAKFVKGETRLVVLASCSSGGGLPVGPEGVGPLVRPLIGARVPAVIGSLWPADDLTAVDLFVSFHQHYRSGKDAATALRSAQLDLLDSGNAALKSAKAWGAFQVIGHASSPFAPTPEKKEKPP